MTRRRKELATPRTNLRFAQPVLDHINVALSPVRLQPFRLCFAFDCLWWQCVRGRLNEDYGYRLLRDGLGPPDVTRDESSHRGSE